MLDLDNYPYKKQEGTDTETDSYISITVHLVHLNPRPDGVLDISTSDGKS